MATAPSSPLAPRKIPRQQRATATLGAIFEATIQVLLAIGSTRLTTTRVAARAGVSVGTMYQYYPHKEALLYAVTERYLNVVAEKVENACWQHHGAPLAQMSDALVNAYWCAKADQREVTRALYLVAVDVNVAALTEDFTRRIELATAAMLASTPEGGFGNLDVVNLSLLTMIFGTVRGVFVREMPDDDAVGVSEQLRLMCRSYLEAARTSH